MTKKKIQIGMGLSLIPTVIAGTVLLNVVSNAQESPSGWKMLLAAFCFFAFVSLFIYLAKKLKKISDAEWYGRD